MVGICCFFYLTKLFCLLFIGIKKWNEYIEENIGDKNGYWEPSLGDGVLTRNLGLNIIVVVTMVCILVFLIIFLFAYFY